VKRLFPRLRHRDGPHDFGWARLARKFPPAFSLKCVSRARRLTTPLHMPPMDRFIVRLCSQLLPRCPVLCVCGGFRHLPSPRTSSTPGPSQRFKEISLSGDALRPLLRRFSTFLRPMGEVSFPLECTRITSHKADSSSREIVVLFASLFSAGSPSSFKRFLFLSFFSLCLSARFFDGRMPVFFCFSHAAFHLRDLLFPLVVFFFDLFERTSSLGGI